MDYSMLNFSVKVGERDQLEKSNKISINEENHRN